MQRDMRRYVVGGNGGFSLFNTDFTWDSYFEHGETTRRSISGTCR
jgi:hypothetical protein